MIDIHPLTDIGLEVLNEIHDKLNGKYDIPAKNQTIKNMINNMKLIYQIKRELEWHQS